MSVNYNVHSDNLKVKAWKYDFTLAELYLYKILLFVVYMKSNTVSIIISGIKEDLSLNE